MRGRVKTFNESKGFGFILGEDEEDYFFHISRVKTIEKLERGTTVTFVPDKNEKGKVAVEVRVLNNNEKTQFITFGDVRIKANNIKNYGITTRNFYFDKYHNKKYSEKELHKARNDMSEWTYMHLVKEVKKCLYVTTYQNDNYEFVEKNVPFDIIKKCQELDEKFS